MYLRTLSLTLAVVIGLAALLLLRPDPARTASVSPAADTYLAFDQNLAHGTESTIDVRADATAVRRAYVRFDFPALPIGQELVSAKLRLTVSSSTAQDRTLTATRIISAWVEDTDVAGAPAFAAVATASVTIAGALVVGATLEWDVTDDVADSYAGAADHGWVLRDNDEATGSSLVKFHSREAAANGPELALVFQDVATPTPSPSPSSTATSTSTGTATATVSPSPTPSPTPAPSTPITSVQSAPTLPVNAPATMLIRVESTVSTIAGAEYTLSAGVAEGSGTAIPPLDSAFDEATEEAAFTLDSCALGDGSHDIYARGRDAAAVWSADAVVTLIVDCTPPAAPVLDPLPASTTAWSVIVSGTREGGSGIWLNGAQLLPPGTVATWSYAVTLAPGAKLLSFTARDVAGNESAAVTRNVTRQAAVVFVSIDPVPTFVSGGTLVLRGARSSGSQVTINGQPADGDGAARWSAIVALAEGGNVFIVGATDGGVEATPVTIVVSRDSTPPRSPTNLRSTPQRDDCTIAPEATIGWDAASDNGSGVSDYRYGWATGADGPYTFVSSGGATQVRANLAPGRWYLRLLAIDAVGNESDARTYGPICLLARGGTLTGTVFIDSDGDGRRWRDPGLSGWRVVATSRAGALDATSAPDGASTLELPMGTFRVCGVISARARLPWEPTKGLLRDGGGGCRDFDVVEGAILAPQDFGFFRPGSLSGTVFRDSDGNGRLGRQEPGMGGVLLAALDGSGRAVEARTDESGEYVLPLPPGEYLLCVIPSPGYLATTPGLFGACLPIAVRSGREVAGPDLGLYQP